MTVHKKDIIAIPLRLRTSNKHGGNRFLSLLIIHEDTQRNLKFNECLEIRRRTLHFLSCISPFKIFFFFFENQYQTFDTEFHYKIKHLEVRRK